MAIPQTEVTLSRDGREVLRRVVRSGEYLIGCGPSADISVQGNLVSPEHARLTINCDEWLIEDIAGSNGIFVGERRVIEATRIFPTQKVRIGEVTLDLQRLKDFCKEDNQALAPVAAELRRLLPRETLEHGGRYELGSVVARGGMGVVLEAREHAIRRAVAMKVMIERNSPDGVRRFIQEAQITGQLEHPNIVPVHELGIDEQDQPFYTMKFVKGFTLKEVLEKISAEDAGTVAAFPLRQLVAGFLRVCDAIAFANSKGVIHRDLKPGNVMIGAFGEVLVMDWGLAKVLGNDECPAAAESGGSVALSAKQDEQTALTMVGAILGTPQYMAPEQASGDIHKIDARTDVYALGAILYHILTLQPPVKAGTEMEMIEGVRSHHFPAPSSFNSPPAKYSKGAIPLPHCPGRRIPGALSAIAMKALAFDQKDRYQNAGDLKVDLDAWLAGFATKAEQAGPVKQIALLIGRHKGIFGTAFAAWALVMGLTAWFVVNVTNETRVARASGERARRSAEAEASARAASDELLTKVQLQRAEDFLAGDDAASGLAYLAAVFRRHPSDTVTAQRLLSALRDRSYSLPVMEPIKSGFAVDGVAFSPDGRRLLVCTGGSAYLYDPRTGQILLKFQNTPRGPRTGSFSPDGKQVLLAGFLDARVFDAGTGDPYGETLLHEGRLSPWYGGFYNPSAQISPEGRSILTTSSDKRAIIWSLVREDHPRLELKQGVEVYSATWSPDGSRVASSSYTGLVIIWDANSGTEISRLQAPPGQILQMFFSPDNERLATISGVVRIWELKSSRMVKEFADGAAFATQSSDGRTLFVADSEHRLLRCDMQTGEILKTRTFPHALNNLEFTGKGVLISTDAPNACVLDPQTLEPLFAPRKLDSEIRAIDLNASGDRMVVATASGKTYIWDVSPRAALPLLLDHGAGDIFAALSPTAKLAVTTGNDGKARVWNTITGQPTGVVVHPATDPSRAEMAAPVFSPDGSRFATGGMNAKAQQWDVTTGKQIGKPLRGGYINQLEYSKDGTRLLVVSSASLMNVWDLTRGVSLAKIDYKVAKAFMTPDGAKLLVLDYDTAQPWSVSPWKPLADAIPHKSEVTRGAVSDDGTWFATGCNDGTARIRDFDSGKLVAGPLSHRGAINGLVFSPDRTLLLTASADGTARLWDAATGRPRAVLNHSDQVSSVAFSADGKRVATASADGTVRIWDSATGRPLSEPLRGHGWMRAVAFSRDGTQLLGTGAGTSAMIWNIETSNQLAPNWLSDWAEAVGGDRLDQNGDLQPVSDTELTSARSKFATLPGEDLYTRTARWFFRSVQDGPISPEKVSKK